MHLTSTTLDGLKIQIQQQLNQPKEPTAIFACPTASLPPASQYPGTIAWDLTRQRITYSDGTQWW